MKEPNITIRPGHLEDAAELAALHQGAGWCYDERNMVAEYHDDSFEPSSVLIAVLDGVVVGKIELYLGWKSTYGRFGVIRRFVVHPDYRQRGVGRRLIDAATERAGELGCSFIELSVDVTNPTAHAFYQRIGFTEDRVEIMMRKPLDARAGKSNYQAARQEWDERQR